ncbi:QWRF motif-containing protein 9-like isoform X2 [Juglans microcarpa x Juglans regia]|uniref:QWRF motif-containing protein 9-like isoform X2 n=1 Tax=Juglans microcarpa x Juglans regia TaxID=2249226 RepID=UPI001B7F4C71|nr:QWRF motif-containing protein 9-like isoform X2 [Juglans microcarpa x Juglans regia]
MSGKGEDYETCSYEEVVNMTYLEEWALKDWDYFSSLLGATEALKASTLRLPVVGGAKAMGSSICLLLLKVGDLNSLVSELGNIRVKDCALLHQWKDLLSTIAVMQE